MPVSLINSFLTIVQSPFFNGKVPVYHSVSKNKEASPFSSGIHDITVEQFEKQLTLLKQKHDFVFVDELAERAKKGKNIRKLVSVTFDDGYKNFLLNALPVLEYLNIPTTMFLTTSLLQGNIFWRDKIRLLIDSELVVDFLGYLKGSLNVSHDLKAEEFYQNSKDPTIFKSSDINSWLDHYLSFKGIAPSQLFKGLYLSRNDIKPHSLVQFGNHTENHFMMSSLSKQQQLAEIENAQNSLKALNIPLSSSFAIPFGNPESYNDDTLRCANELGFKTVLLAGADRARGFVKKSKLTTNDNTLIGMRFLPGKDDLFGK